MNERIRELAEQAGIDFFNSIDPEFSGREYCEAWTEQQQKFAELIVRETLMQMAIQMDKFGDDQANNPAWYKSEEAVKKHFGIQE